MGDAVVALLDGATLLAVLIQVALVARWSGRVDERLKATDMSIGHLEVRIGDRLREINRRLDRRSLIDNGPKTD